MFITRAGTYARSSLWRWANIFRSAASIAPGVVSSSRQTSSMARALASGAGAISSSAAVRPAGAGRVGVQRLVSSAHAFRIGSMIDHCAITSSLRVNSVASPRIASRISRS